MDEYLASSGHDVLVIHDDLGELYLAVTDTLNNLIRTNLKGTCVG